jgi:hypothetical protein
LDTQSIIAQLERERDRLNDAIRALQGTDVGNGRGTGGAKAANGRRGRPPLSAAARKRISMAMKARWAKRKKKK